MRMEVRKTDLGSVRFVKTAAALPAPGEVLVRVERFAITANNVTYGVVGERIGYWKFFPAEEGWGVIPVWGVGVVEASAHPEVREGERLYGYWPMASHLTLVPGKVGPMRLMDGASHRAGLPAVYNSYLRLDAEEGYDKATDRARMALWPLYATSFCLADWLAANGNHGAEQVVIPSASSKTAIGLAHALIAEGSPLRRVAATSARNAGMVAALGLYEDVILYEEIEERIARVPTVIVDMSGSGDVIGRLHRHLGEAMRFTSNVGVTHHEAAGMGPDFIRERSAMFFAPAHIARRTEEWGPGAFEARSTAFWRDAAGKSAAWLTYRDADGPEATEAAWREVLEGRARPDEVWTAAL